VKASYEAASRYRPACWPLYLARDSQYAMKQAIVLMLMFAIQSGVASALVNAVPPNLTHAVRVTKPAVTAAKSVVASISNMSKVQVPSVNSSVVRLIAANDGKPTATSMNSAVAAVVPAYPRQQQVASKNTPVAVSLSAKVNSHMQAPRPLLPIGEGAYQSAEAVAQRTLDSNRDCEKNRWNGCFHNDKADIVDGESYGNLRGAESGEASNLHGAESGTKEAGPQPAPAPAPAPPPAPPAGPIPNPFDKSSAAGCFKGLAFTVALLSLSVGAHS